MSTITKAEQVRRQYVTVVHLARSLATVYEQSAFMAHNETDDGLLQIMGNLSAEAMEILGDILNGMEAGFDSVSEDDANLGNAFNVNDVFDMAHIMFPVKSARSLR
jgi:hypothetical protein